MLDGVACPDEEGATKEAWTKADNRLYSIIYSACATVRAFEGKDIGSLGDGAAACAVLMDQFDGDTQEARRLLLKKSYSDRLTEVCNVVDFLAQQDVEKLRLEEMGELISDFAYLDVVLQSITVAEAYEFIKVIHRGMRQESRPKRGKRGKARRAAVAVLLGSGAPTARPTGTPMRSATSKRSCAGWL